MRRLSLAARDAQEAAHTDEVEIALVIIEHPDIPGGVLRLSSDPTERLTVEPEVTYGTLSTWRSPGGEPFYFTIMDAVVPDEKDDAPAAASLVLALLESAMGEVLTSTTVQAICHMAIVLASSPNVAEAEWLDMLLPNAQIDATSASLQFSTESLYDEPFPAARMTKERFPGLHR